MIDIENKNILELDDSVLDKYFFQEEKLKIIEFLLENGIIRKEEKKNIDVKRVFLLSNDERFVQSMLFNLKDILELHILDMDCFEKYDFYQGDLVIFF